MSEKNPQGGPSERDSSSLKQAIEEFLVEQKGEFNDKWFRIMRIAEARPDIMDTPGFQREAGRIQASREILTAIGAIVMSNGGDVIDDDIKSLFDNDEVEAENDGDPHNPSD